jgi:hypothetical protein
MVGGYRLYGIFCGIAESGLHLTMFPLSIFQYLLTYVPSNIAYSLSFIHILVVVIGNPRDSDSYTVKYRPPLPKLASLDEKPRNHATYTKNIHSMTLR